MLSKNNKIVNPDESDIVIGKFSDGLLQLNVKPYCLPGNTSLLVSELYEGFKIAEIILSDSESARVSCS